MWIDSVGIKYECKFKRRENTHRSTFLMLRDNQYVPANDHKRMAMVQQFENVCDDVWRCDEVGLGEAGRGKRKV